MSLCYIRLGPASRSKPRRTQSVGNTSRSRIWNCAFEGRIAADRPKAQETTREAILRSSYKES